mmetsp:Transcript_97688/g.209621  ORF Transcript_97688/g.209621 Transcript_97688/m.209621 type:complete len:200 (+) Transcript_97688:55-654(+)|eukprot:CAMPEP_0180654596 /NCGR_PEP_ID=MMETSP1037_2-20121125/54791_1 /TAXON_ID=632150 /ORGANISM="Azadinium spinosum, Strain 3D9" /LENGTH=199 /DNA_ID=CAMNT_0022680899 /DNA_START=1 /DNA_END=597 /DNA_ORIENTATION=+
MALAASAGGPLLLGLQASRPRALGSTVAARPQRCALQGGAASGGAAALAALALGVVGLASSAPLRPSRRRRCGRQASTATTRSALELPVREPEIKTPVSLPGASLKEETRQKRADKYRLLLYNDAFNKREFVARCLMTITLLKEGEAYQVMMVAHTEGVAVVGTYPFETAEAYCEGLKVKGLTVDIEPVDGDDDKNAPG